MLFVMSFFNIDAMQRKLSELQKKKNPKIPKAFLGFCISFNECSYKYKIQCIDAEKIDMSTKKFKKINRNFDIQ